MIELNAIFFMRPALLSSFFLLPFLWLVIRRLSVGQTGYPCFKRALIRIAFIFLLIIGAARPVVAPSLPVKEDRPMLLVIDDGLYAAQYWEDQKKLAASLLRHAQLYGTGVVLFTSSGSLHGEVLRATDALNHLDNLRPSAQPTDRNAIAEKIKEMAEVGIFADGARAVWLSDGVGNADRLTTALMALGSLEIFLPPEEKAFRLLLPLKRKNGALTLQVQRPVSASSEAEELTVRGETEEGHVLFSEKLSFARKEDIATHYVRIPPPMLAEIDTFHIAGRHGLGAERKNPETWQTGTGLVAKTEDAAFPLADPSVFLKTALQIQGHVETGSLSSLLSTSPLPARIVLPYGAVSDQDAGVLKRYIERGGLFIRFLEAPPIEKSGLTALPLVGKRVPGLFGASSRISLPFSGALSHIKIEKNTLLPEIARQALSRPEQNSKAEIWAKLEDGTPLVSAKGYGKGRIVQFHTSPTVMKGLSEDQTINRRSFVFSPLFPLMVQSVMSSEKMPENLSSPIEGLHKISVPEGVILWDAASVSGGQDLRLFFLAVAFLLILWDLSFLRRKGLAVLFIVLCCAHVYPAQASNFERKRSPQVDTLSTAQIDALLKTRLGFVLRGKSKGAKNIYDGLLRLSETLNAVEKLTLAAPSGSRFTSETLALLPLLYWAPEEGDAPLSEDEKRALQRFLEHGFLVVDLSALAATSQEEWRHITGFSAGRKSQYKPLPEDRLFLRRDRTPWHILWAEGDERALRDGGRYIYRILSGEAGAAP